MTNNKIIAFTGHRPNKLGGYFNKIEHARIRGILMKEIQSASFNTKELVLISGGAIGFDTLVIEAFERLEDTHPNIKLIIAEPFPNHFAKWPKEVQAEYLRLKDFASEVVVVSTGPYHPAKMQIRNQFMVDKCDELWGYWDGSAGGTANCINYAKKISKPVRNLY